MFLSVCVCVCVCGIVYFVYSTWKNTSVYVFQCVFYCVVGVLSMCVCVFEYMYVGSIVCVCVCVFECVYIGSIACVLACVSLVFSDPFNLSI